MNVIREKKSSLRRISQAHMRYLEKMYVYSNKYQYIFNADLNSVHYIYYQYYLKRKFIDSDIDANIYIEYSEFFNEVIDILVKNFKTWGENVLHSGRWSLEDLHKVKFNVGDRFMNGGLYMARIDSLLDTWKLKYKGPVIHLGDISNDPQSVHEDFIEKNTGKGARILEEFPVPRGQKTLKEIEICFIKIKIAKEDDIVMVLNDMKDWGSRESVVKKEENLYRKVLRGLWAKINTYEQTDVKEQLIIRLWEECVESIGMCADGHISRLVNVLSGFDKDFESNISPMEYFQNNIALISENEHATHELKIEHAIKLMNDIGMPQDKRGEWLDAL